MSHYPPPPPSGRKPSWPGIALTATGSILVGAAVAIVGALVVALLFWQILANMVMVVFVQDLRWYGPGVYTAGGDLWWWVFGISALGAVILTGGLLLLTREGHSAAALVRKRHARGM